ncbi:M91 family zinc metallopeptidase [Xenorhabdus sp. PR6a]|uniref:M91 family zinc metallopeptidase n=1 Tax=Xenorhabdus sp. PR6a TaxID=3025877 RepID=UPI002358FC4A|nr:M91 family zinc metallopeptidase [Xenorhabdus sp. PR6a]MDC9580023.1 M91 family zinc metallopeptidase [Xenorhabdus sp. PR6a]
MKRPTSLPPISLPSSSVTNIENKVRNSPVQWIRNNQQLSFQGNNLSLYQSFEKAIQKIESTPTGKTLLDCIKSISCLKSEKLIIDLSLYQLCVKPHRIPDAHNHRGTGSVFYCNLTKAAPLCESGMQLPDFYACIVFHELLHVLHNLNGERLVVMSSGLRTQMVPKILLEEARTVGLGRFSSETLSENKFREEIHVPRRTFYQHDPMTIHDDNTGSIGFGSQKRLHPLL